MQLNREARPVYEQVKEGIRRLLLAGAVLPQEQMLPVHELSSRLAINPSAIERAYRELEEEGYLYTEEDGRIFVGSVHKREEKRRAELLEQFDCLLEQLAQTAVSEEELLNRVTRRMKGDRK